MCDWCNNESDKCIIHKKGSFHCLEVEEQTYDFYNDKFNTVELWINYCPFCGRKLDVKHNIQS